MALTSAALTFALSFTQPAAANYRNLDARQCDGWGWNFQLFYNRNLTGASAAFGYDEENFGVPDTNLGPYRFCSDGNGSGAVVKNAAASARNRTQHNATVYYNSWFHGKSDVVETQENLDSTFNNNASFQFTD
ncbi:peptidase inhibitor family I36 protein [Streptomyces sp. NPDC026206]|uniref:peptidase inhibitor family I36 protein n=1 Tax=Streptomyces sp. NPDC026206 TaxID=3157089 RepID=UPI0033E918A4